MIVFDAFVCDATEIENLRRMDIKDTSSAWYRVPYKIDLQQLVAYKSFDINFDGDLLPCVVLTVKGIPYDITIDYPSVRLDRVLQKLGIEIKTPEQILAE